MSDTGVFLSVTDLSRLTPDAREEVQRIVFGGKEETETPANAIRRLLGRIEPADLTHEQAEKLMVRLNPKTVSYLRVFLRPGSWVNLTDLLDATGYQDYRQLTGITSGLTKRLRNILDDDLADLVVRVWDSSVPMHARTLDNARFKMSPQTVGSLRAVLEREGGTS